MNKLFTKIAAACVGLAMAVGVGVAVGSGSSAPREARADTVTMAYPGGTTGNFAENTNVAASLGLSATDWDVRAAKGSASNNVGYNSAGDFRLYYNASGSNTLTVTSSQGWTITGLSLTYTGANYNNCTISPGTISNSGTSGTATLSSTSFTLGNGNSSNVQVRISSVVITYSAGATKYSVTYNQNNTEAAETMTDPDSPYEKNDTVTVLANEFTAPEGYKFDHWNTADDDSGVDYDAGDTFSISANTTLYAQWAEDLGDLTGKTGTANFGNASGSTQIKAATGSFKDSLGVSWSWSIDWGSATPSYTQNAAYSQIGASGKLCNSVTLTATLPDEYKVTDFSVKTGGFSGTSGTAALKVETTTVGSGNITSSDVVTSATDKTVVGDDLSVILTGSSSMRFKLYYISYTLGASKTLSNIALSGSYQTAFTVGDTFNHTGMVVTANYDDSTSATVTGSATWSSPDMSSAGQKTVTVSYSDEFGSATKDYSITVSAPVTPYISPEKSTTSGYTGCSETISFSYGNLTGTLDAATSNNNISAVIDNDDGESSADVVISFGSVEITSKSYVYLKDGSTTRATIEVTKVDESTVTIVGLPATATLYNNSTLNLGSQITVTPTGSCSSAVTWESDDETVATVDGGVVTPVANGEVNITVTSDDYPSATMTCVVTVSDPLIEATYNFVTRFATYASSWTGYASRTLNGKTDIGGDYAATITLPYGSKQTTNITTMPVVADESDGDVVHISFELTEAGYELGDVSVTFAQWTTKAPTMKLFKGTTATGTALDSGVVGTKNTISATNVGGTTFVVAENDGGTSKNQVGIQSIRITLKPAPVLSSVTTSGQKASFEYGDTFSYGGTLTAHYTQGKADATVSPSKFKYGATSNFDADTTGTEITVGASLSHTTHDGKYVKVGYSEDSGVTYKWTDAYQISVEDEPAHYMILDAYTDTGTDYGYKGGVIEIDVTDSNLAGNISWDVTAGSVSGATYDNTSYLATITSVGTLTIVATDSGDNTNTRTVSITVIDSLNTVMAPSETPHTSSLIFTAECGGSGTADDGATYAITSDADESTFDEARGIHYGTTSSAKVQYVQLSSSNVASGANNKIKSIVINASDAQSGENTASLTVTVGDSSFHCDGSTSAKLGGQADYTFTGSGSGTVVIRAERSGAMYKGIFFKSVVVNYVTEGEEGNIANATDMHLAQKAVLDYAEDFNDTLEEICVAIGSTDVETLEGAWSTLATQYDNWFNKGAKELSSGEIAHAKALFAHASSVDRNKTPSADELQHMLAKYDWIVEHYSGCEDFLNTDAGTGRDPVNQVSSGSIFNIIGEGTNSVAAIVVISVISAAAVGGYFFLRRRKEI